MQTLVQTQKMDQLEQEVHELHEEVTTLQAEVEKLTNLVSLMSVTQDQPQVQQSPQLQCQPLCIQQPRQQVSQQYNSQGRNSRAPQLGSIPMKYAEFLPTLLNKNLVQTRAPLPVPERLPTRYRADQFCAFHQGALVHDTEQCYGLRTVVQRLIQAKKIPSANMWIV